MTTDQDCFRRAARQFLAEVEAERQAAERLHKQQAKEERARMKKKEKLLSEDSEVG